ncbi:ABC transporter permease [Faecalicatena contorta]|uniref:Monosaccharide ABC transporter membrane protein, CUT2 family n=1 Tax=Faecalicatena contorta TaxID=39482 RepID=A0A315ZZ51_9FIRM|nr:ABC transporter permease [Faecalicatena contorta]PWJ50178.1 monosaccharide ABC transporter membrane protein (CUT2 family) [Faecalicatena contorta]SUQ14299.1 monosaccharide ABC transporter membrane protein, CUT2 family [Faecalicatena contorta]
MVNKIKINPAGISTILLSRGTGIGMIIILCVLGIRAPLFFDLANIMTVLKQGSVLTMIALGLTAVLIGGGFDMGAGALVQLTCNLSAGLIIAGTSAALALTTGVAVGLCVGLINGFLVIVVKIPTFVATLGTMFVMQGVTSWYNGGKALTIKVIPGFAMLGQGRIAIIPVIFLIVIAVCIILNYFFKHTRTGIRMYATGENPAAAKLKGLNTKKYLLLSYLLSGLILGFTGVLQCSYNYGASAITSGMDFLIQALSAAYLGSTFSRTGELSVIGTVISGMFIAALSNALIINGTSNQQISGVLGVILILSILLTVIKKREIGQVTIF